LATQTAKTRMAPTIVTAGTTRLVSVGNSRSPGSDPSRSDLRLIPPGAARLRRTRRKAPLCRVGRSMNLRKQVEPLLKAALQASSLQRHAHHAASRLTWVIRWLKRACRHHAQSRELKRSKDLSVRLAGFARICRAHSARSAAIGSTRVAAVQKCNSRLPLPPRAPRLRRRTSAYRSGRRPRACCA